jgi:hypothetical protein
MVLADFWGTVQGIAAVITLLVPIILLVIALLVKKGIITKDQAETAESIIRVLTDSIETFKADDKPASKSLTELVKAKATGAKVTKELDAYLKKYDLNQPNKR